MTATTLAQLMAHERVRRQWSVSELANRIGVAPSMVSRWLKGTQPSTESCDLIADALGMDVDYILALAGHRPATLSHRNQERDAIIAMIRRARLDEERTATIRFFLGMWSQQDRRGEGAQSNAPAQ